MTVASQIVRSAKKVLAIGGRPHMTVALANKLARIVCAMMKTGEGFRAGTFAKA